MRGTQGRGLESLNRSAALGHRRPRARDVVVDAFGLYRRRFRRVAGSAVVVFGATGWLEALTETVIDEHRLVGSGWDVVLELFASIVGTLGLVVYSGLLDKVLEDHLDGRPDRRLRQALRELPLGRLLVADIVLVLATAIGTVLLLVPGFIAFNLLCLVGPLIVAENLDLRAGLRRSAQLVRHRFVLVFVLVTIPVTLEEDIVHAIDYHEFGHPLIAAFLVVGVLSAIVVSMIGLVEVVIAHQLARTHPNFDGVQGGTVRGKATTRRQS